MPLRGSARPPTRSIPASRSVGGICWSSRRLPGHQQAYPISHVEQRLPQTACFGRALCRERLQAFLLLGDADFKKFVEVAADDGQVAQALRGGDLMAARIARARVR